MQTNLDRRRIIIFLGFAFGIAWLAGLVIYLTGGLSASPQIAPGISLALVLLATVYMSAPALAHVLTRLITREGWQEPLLRPHFRKTWRFWVMAWFLPALLTLAGMAAYYLIFPADFDPQLGIAQKMLTGPTAAVLSSPWMFVALQTLIAILVAPLINSLFTFGEEFGWRAYLLPKLMPLGARKALLVSGAIWGVWHWPVIFMGYEYGFKYPGYPWAGPLLFCWITFGFGTLLGWLSWRGRSVWPAAIGHAALNGIAGVSILLSKGEPNMLLGPTPVGLIGTAAFSIFALVIFFRSTAWKGSEAPPADSM